MGDIEILLLIFIFYFVPLAYLIWTGYEEDDGFKWMWIGCGVLPVWGACIALVVFLCKRTS